MRISDLLASEKPCLSFEVFPPKREENYDAVSRAALEIAALGPGFMSVTYGAGGGSDRYTLDIARQIQRSHGVPALAHLTCAGNTKLQLNGRLEALRAAGIENILALRGDLPEGQTDGGDYRYAADLVREIAGYGGFCVGGACYPEGHVECASPALDRLRLKEKAAAGLDFLTTQMFFDNDLLYKFIYQIRELGVTVPVVAGIMPVTNGAQIARICKLSGTRLPARFTAIVDKFGASPPAMFQAGVVYACAQIIDLLAGGVRHVHVYSMNRPEVARAIYDNIKESLF